MNVHTGVSCLQDLRLALDDPWPDDESSLLVECFDVAVTASHDAFGKADSLIVSSQ